MGELRIVFVRCGRPLGSAADGHEGTAAITNSERIPGQCAVSPASPCRIFAMSRLADDLGLSDQIFPLWVLRRSTADQVRLVSRGSGGLVWPGICWKGCRTVGPVAPSALVFASVSAEVEVRVAGMRREHPRRPALEGRSVWTGLERDHASCSRGSVSADRARSSRAVRALGERLQVWAAVVVGGCGEVELPGAGRHGDDEREVAHDRHHGERLQQPRAGKIQRHRRARDVGHDQVHRPLPRKVPVPGALAGASRPR